MKLIPTHRLLSAWIFIYSIFYCFKLVPYNPIILLYIAYGFSIMSSSIMMYYSNHHNGLLFYFSINTVFKFIPILLIYKNTINIQDIVFTSIFIIIYVVYMLYIRDDIICTYKDMINYYIDENIGRQTEIAYYIRKYIPYTPISTV